MTTSIQRTIRFDRKQYAGLDKIAKQQNRNFSDVLRQAIDHYLDDLKVHSASQLRQARVVEYAQIALDAIIQEQHPEYRDRILAETNRRMERYHGA